jgi:hypothetical protein
MDKILKPNDSECVSYAPLFKINALIFRFYDFKILDLQKIVLACTYDTAMFLVSSFVSWGVVRLNQNGTSTTIWPVVSIPDDA